LLNILGHCTKVVGLSYTVLHTSDKVFQVARLILSKFIHENILVEVVDTELDKYLS
jgi:hypothetical protein